MDGLKFNKTQEKVREEFRYFWRMNIQQIILNELFTTGEIKLLLKGLMPESEVIVELCNLQSADIIRQTPEGFWVLTDTAKEEYLPL